MIKRTKISNNRIDYTHRVPISNRDRCWLQINRDNDTNSDKTYKAVET